MWVKCVSSHMRRHLKTSPCVSLSMLFRKKISPPMPGHLSLAHRHLTRVTGASLWSELSPSQMNMVLSHKNSPVVWKHLLRMAKLRSSLIWDSKVYKSEDRGVWHPEISGSLELRKEAIRLLRISQIYKIPISAVDYLTFHLH